MQRDDLLIEIGTEELPPKTLKKLAIAFDSGIAEGLHKQELSYKSHQWFATPRRLAVIFKGLDAAQADREELKRGPALAAAFDSEGDPTPAAEGFARSCNTNVNSLSSLKTEKGEWLSYKVQLKGKSLTELLSPIIDHSIKILPIAKRMRWGNHDVQFVRPVHWSLVLFGQETIQLKILGTDSSNITYGHRFHHPDAIAINHAEEYVSKLKKPGMVIVDYEERKQVISDQLSKIAESLNGRLKQNPDLLDEVTSINEWPIGISGNFDERFLNLPKEVLISSMQSHQKYFPVFNQDEKLLPHFITFANIESKNADAIKSGNERVLLPRLSDAEFFWDKDQKQKLEDYAIQLKDVLFQKKLGTLSDKVERINAICTFIAEKLSANVALVQQAAKLSKCDLMTSMVGEFPTLQGTIGKYYAEKNGAHPDVAKAIEEQYQPRFAGDTLPQTPTGQILSLAEKLDTLCGIFSIGQIPTGDKDPFALRRAALGMVRLIIERKLELDLMELLEHSLLNFPVAEPETQEKLHAFILDRLRSYYLEKNISHGVINSVLAVQNKEFVDIDERVAAVIAFSGLDDAEALAATNKRISNILKKSDLDTNKAYDKTKLQEDAEIQLVNSIEKINVRVSELMQSLDYSSALTALAGLREVIDNFFDNVMVNCDDDVIKNNRIAILSTVQGMFNQVADISEL